MAFHLANGVSESRDGTVPPGGVQRERMECMSGGETRVAKAGSFDPTSGIWVEPVSWMHRQSGLLPFPSSSLVLRASRIFLYIWK